MDERTASPPSVVVKQFSKKVERPRRRNWLKRTAIALVLLAVVVFFAPSILTTTMLKHGVPKMIASKIPLHLEWGELSLGWMSPVVIKDLKVQDDQGNPLLDVQKISTGHSLWRLAAQSGNLGTLTLTEPIVHVSLRNNGSNVEDLIAKFASGTSTTSATESNKPSTTGSLPSVTIEIEKAKIELDHKASGRQSTLDEIECRIVSSKGAVDEFDLAIGAPGSIHHEPSIAEPMSSNSLTAHFGNSSPTESGSVTPGSKRAVLRASHWQLNWLEPGLARVMPKAELKGELNAEASVELAPNSSSFDFDWEGTVSLDRLLLAGIDALKQDRLAFDQIELSGRVATTQGRLVMNDLKVGTDIGELVATGDVPLDPKSKKSAAELIQSLLSDEDYHVVGDLDLKKLAAMLPQTLRIRDGIEITGGEVKLQIAGDDSTGVRRWSGAAGIIGLTAEHQGKSIPWDKPLVARASAHRDQATIIVDQLECKSDFLQVKGSGTLEDAKFNATGDLSKLLENLERFVDLGIEQLSGQLSATGELRQIDDEHVGFASKILVDNFAYDVSKNHVWHEDHLVLSINATGLANTTSGLTRIDTAEMHLTSAGDVMDSKVVKPIDLKSKTPTYAIEADVKGNLATWQNRLRSFVGVNDWKLEGSLDLETSVEADTQAVDVSKFSIVVRNLEVDGPGLVVQDPEMSLETAGEWDFSAQKWTSPKTLLTGHSLSLEIDSLECAIGKQGIVKLAGTAEYEADLTEVSHWVNQAMEKPAYYLVGTLTGKAILSQQEGVITAKLDTNVEKLVVAGFSATPQGKPDWVVLWKEPQLKVGATARYDGATDQVWLDSSLLEVDGLSVGAKGTLEACSTKQQIDLTGDLAYDWERLVKRFGESLAKHVQLSGKDRRPFSMKGSLASFSKPAGPSSTGKTAAAPVAYRPKTTPTSSEQSTSATGGILDLSGQAGLGWTAANVYGIVAGPGDISAKLENGVCQFAPLDITVNEGKLHLTPTVHLESDPSLLVLPQEKVIDKIRLSPELCSGWLKFVVPALADSAQVEGKFSLDMQAASLPLSAPATGSVDATLAVHQVQVRPGPLALKIVSAIDQVQTIISRRPLGDLSQDVWLEMPEQQIPFKLEQGRVHHQGMTFTVKNVAVKTSGSVGLDETLQLIAEIPVRNEWLGSNKVFAGLKGQSIQIPINGTLTSPQLDPRVFSNLTQQMGGTVIEGLLKDQVGDKLDGAINKGLDRLFGGKK